MLGLSAGAALTGCASSAHSASRRPAPLWPSVVARPDPHAKSYAVPPKAHESLHTLDPAAATGAVAALNAVPRSRWAKGQPIQDRLNPMLPPTKITLHHEGWTPVYFTAAQDTADRLEVIRRSHLNRMTAGDIGYHFIVDRTGRIWEGRSLAYQGAHVKDNNEHNVGIMVLGNFDQQAPSDEQLNAVRTAVTTIRSQYRIAARNVFTHQEINPTACPGSNLQPKIVSLRSRDLL
jgi:hypothetical protein